MTLSQNVADLALRIATEAKAHKTFINGNAADLTGLATAAKGNLVLAINELAGIVAAATNINDATTTTTTTWSSSKVSSSIATAIAALIDSSPGTLDTLNELAAALGDDPNFAATIAADVANRVRFDAAQTLTSPQKIQARANIDAADATAVGSTSTNYVTIFEAALV